MGNRVLQVATTFIVSGEYISSPQYQGFCHSLLPVPHGEVEGRFPVLVCLVYRGTVAEQAQCDGRMSVAASCEQGRVPLGTDPVYV